MKSLQHYFARIHALLKELIDVSTQLRDTSKQVISQEELAPLQDRQGHLLKEIAEVDHDIQRYYRDEVDSSTRAEWHQQLHVFKQLNQEFVNNLRISHGLIQFDMNHVRERTIEEENPDLSFILSRLNKMFSSPNSSETIESEESKEER